MIGFGTTLFEIRSVALRVPVAFGLNVTLTVQDVFAARVEPQVLEAIAKSPGFVPVKPIPLIVIDLVSRFLNVITFGALVVPTVVFGNLNAVGVRVIAAVPVPVKLTDCGLLGAVRQRQSCAPGASCGGGEGDSNFAGRIGGNTGPTGIRRNHKIARVCAGYGDTGNRDGYTVAVGHRDHLARAGYGSPCIGEG